MYGNQDAAANWEHKHAKRDKSSPCVFWSPETGVRCVVHGDDFTVAGRDGELAKCTKMQQRKCDATVRGKLDPDAKDN